MGAGHLTHNLGVKSGDDELTPKLSPSPNTQKSACGPLTHNLGVKSGDDLSHTKIIPPNTQKSACGEHCGQ
eukprot:scaffold80017_cov39-Cyclotella_meneghiniana.AAC.1